MSFIEDIQRKSSFNTDPSNIKPNIDVRQPSLFNYRDNFLRLMENWEFAVPNNTLWIVFIAPYPAAINARDFIVFEGSDGTNKPNNIDTDVRLLTSSDYQQTQAGCVFVNGLNIPGENINMQRASILNNRGYIPGLIGGHRADFNPVTTQIIESNRSFTHSIIRPWQTLAAHYGLVAREPGDIKNIKTNLQIIQLGKTLHGSSLVNRKIIRFYDAVPMSYTPQNMPYNATDLVTFDVQWAYNRYDIETLPDTNVDIILKEALKHPFSNFLNKITDGKIDRFMKKVGRFEDKVHKVGRTIEKIRDLF